MMKINGMNSCLPGPVHHPFLGAVAKELYEFAERTMKDPAPSRYQSESVKVKRRIFFYDGDILLNRRDRYFKEVRGNRSIHAVVSTDGGCSISTRCSILLL